MQSGDPADRNASYRNYDTVRGLYGQMPGGMFASDENCREGKDDPRQSVETCGKHALHGAGQRQRVRRLDRTAARHVVHWIGCAPPRFPPGV